MHSIINKFVANNISFVLSLLCYCWSSFHKHGSNKLVTMGLICIEFLCDFCWLLAFVFSLGCVYMCFHLPCTFDGWVPILEFYIQGFCFFIKAISALSKPNPYSTLFPSGPLFNTTWVCGQTFIHASSLYFNWTLCKLWHPVTSSQVTNSKHIL